MRTLELHRRVHWLEAQLGRQLQEMTSPLWFSTEASSMRKSPTLNRDFEDLFMTTPLLRIPSFMGHGSGVIVQLVEAEPDLVNMTLSVIPCAVFDRGATGANPSCKGPGGPQGLGPQGPMGGPTSARPTRAQGAHKGGAHKGQRWPTRA